MVHPFDMELGDDGRLYMSCQGTNTVVATAGLVAESPPELCLRGGERRLERRIVHEDRRQGGAGDAPGVDVDPMVSLQMSRLSAKSCARVKIASRCSGTIAARTIAIK